MNYLDDLQCLLNVSIYGYNMRNVSNDSSGCFLSLVSLLVNRETMLASSASAIINGIVAITLLPKFGRMQRATPHVIMDNETMSNKCCHENEMIFFI